MFGVGVPNPYRLRPFIGAKVPVNSSFSPIINIHNPHSEPLQASNSIFIFIGMLKNCNILCLWSLTYGQSKGWSIYQYSVNSLVRYHMTTPDFMSLFATIIKRLLNKTSWPWLRTSFQLPHYLCLSKVWEDFKWQ